MAYAYVHVEQILWRPREMPVCVQQIDYVSFVISSLERNATIVYVSDGLAIVHPVHSNQHHDFTA
eukprot:SAG11_NODE_28093_length_325_cov_1.269912_1_plen_64_part_10